MKMQTDIENKSPLQHDTGRGPKRPYDGKRNVSAEFIAVSC